MFKRFGLQIYERISKCSPIKMIFFFPVWIWVPTHRPFDQQIETQAEVCWLEIPEISAISTSVHFLGDIDIFKGQPQCQFNIYTGLMAAVKTWNSKSAN